MPLKERDPRNIDPNSYEAGRDSRVPSSQLPFDSPAREGAQSRELWEISPHNPNNFKNQYSNNSIYTEINSEGVPWNEIPNAFRIFILSILTIIFLFIIYLFSDKMPIYMKVPIQSGFTCTAFDKAYEVLSWEKNNSGYQSKLIGPSFSIIGICSGGFAVMDNGYHVNASTLMWKTDNHPTVDKIHEPSEWRELNETMKNCPQLPTSIGPVSCNSKFAIASLCRQLIEKYSLPLISNINNIPHSQQAGTGKYLECQAEFTKFDGSNRHIINYYIARWHGEDKFKIRIIR